MNSKILSIIICICILSLTAISLVDAVAIKNVASNPKEIAPGEVATISIKIENILEQEVKNLEVMIDLNQVPFAPYQSSSEKFLDKLDEEDDETFEFKLIALPETASGIYKIPIKINYIYEEESETKEELISLIVNSDPKLKVSLEDSVVLIKGRENEIEIKIVNYGLSDVKFVYLETKDISGLKFLTNKEQYLGNIDSDDFDSIKYKIYLENDANGLIELLVKLSYKDSTNKEYEETQIIPLKVYSLKEAQDLGLVKRQNYTLYIFISLAVVGFFIYRILKKRKLKKKREA